MALLATVSAMTWERGGGSAIPFLNGGRCKCDRAVVSQDPTEGYR